MRGSILGAFLAASLLAGGSMGVSGAPWRRKAAIKQWRRRRKSHQRITPREALCRRLRAIAKRKYAGLGQRAEWYDTQLRQINAGKILIVLDNIRGYRSYQGVV